MAVYCIPKQFIHKLKKAFSDLGDGQIIKLANISLDEKIDFFSKYVPKEEATLLSKEFEKSYTDKRLRALGDWVKNNLDEEYRQKRLDVLQRATIKRYISEKSAKKPSEIKPMSEIIGMDNDTRLNYLTDLMGKEEAESVNQKINEKTQKRLDDEIEFLTKNFKNIEEVNDFIIRKTDIITDQKVGLSLTEEEIKSVMIIGEKQKETAKILAETEPIKNGRLNPKYKIALYRYYRAVMMADDFLLNSTDKNWSETLNSHLKALMLSSPKSIALNIISNEEKMFFDKAVKRIITRQWRGYNAELAKDMANTLYNISQYTSKTIGGKKIGIGYDLSRSLSIDEIVDKKIIGEKMEIGQDTNFTRLVYEVGLGRADYYSARVSFVDSLNLYSSEMADSMGLKGKEAKQKAMEIMVDAFDISPKTKEGQKIREMAVRDAQHSTWTDKRALGTFLIRVRENVNKATAKTGIKFGDIFEPFIRTTSNIIQFGVDISGIGVPKSAYKFFKYYQNKETLTREESADLLKSAIKDLTLTVGGLTMAFLIASFIDDDDFVGAYDPNRIKYDELRNSNSNAVKIFGHWVSLDYAIVAMPLIGILYAKKYGKDNMAEQVYQYARGVLTQSSTAPVVSTMTEMAVDFSRKFGDTSEISDAYKYLSDSFLNQVFARVPSVLQDLAKITDNTRRDTTKIADKFLAKIPFLSKYAPEKKNILGEPIKTGVGMADTFSGKFKAAIIQLLAGERVKKGLDEEINNEILRLKNKGFAPTITDWKYRLPERLQKLKEQVGEDKFQTIFTEEFGKKLKVEIEKLLSNESYLFASDEDKKKKIDKKEDQIIESIYDKYKIK